MMEEFVFLRGRKRHRPEETHPDQRILRYRRKRWNIDGEFDDDDYVEKASLGHHASLQTISETVLCNGLLNTTTQHDSAIFGNMFDIKTNWKPVRVTGFDLLSDASQVEYKVFTRPGSYLSGQSAINGWILVSKGSVDVQGGLVPIRWVGHVQIADISVQAFYVTLTTKNLRHHADPYLLVDAAFVGNADLDINVGIGVSYPLGSSTTQGVLFSGTVYYETEGECSTGAQSLVGRTEKLPAISQKPRATSLPSSPIPQRPSESPSPVGNPSNTGETVTSVPATTSPSGSSRSDSLHPTISVFPTLKQTATPRPTRRKTSSSPTPSPSVDIVDPAEAMSPPVSLVTSVPTMSICVLIPELCNPTTSPSVPPPNASSAVPSKRTLEPSMTTPKPTSRVTRTPIVPAKSPMTLRTQVPSLSPPAAPSLNPSICLLIPELCAPTTSPSSSSPSMSPVVPKATSKPVIRATGGPVDPTRSPVTVRTDAPTPKPSRATRAPVNPTRSPTAAPTAAPTTKPSRATRAPVDPTRSPATATARTASPTPKPSRATKAPVDPTRSPATATARTAAPTPKPSRATRAPAAPTPKPSRPTRSPVDPTKSPVTVRTPAPTPKPSRATKAPVDPTRSPITVRTAAPTTKPPSRATGAPVDPTRSPTTSPTRVPTAKPNTPVPRAPVDPTKSPITVQTAVPTTRPPLRATRAPIDQTRAPTTASTQVPSVDPGLISLSPPVSPTLNPSICLLIPELCAQTVPPNSTSSKPSSAVPTTSPEPTKATDIPSSRASPTPVGPTKSPIIGLSDVPTLAPGMPSVSPPLNPTICFLMPQLCFPTTSPNASPPNTPPVVSQQPTLEPTKDTGNLPSVKTRSPIGLTSSPGTVQTALPTLDPGVPSLSPPVVLTSNAIVCRRFPKLCTPNPSPNIVTTSASPTSSPSVSLGSELRPTACRRFPELCALSSSPNYGFPLIFYRPRSTPMPNTPTLEPSEPSVAPPQGSTFNPNFCYLMPTLCFPNNSPRLSASPTVTPSATLPTTRTPTKVAFSSTPSLGILDRPTGSPSSVESYMPAETPDMSAKTPPPAKSDMPAQTPSPALSDVPTRTPSLASSDGPTKPASPSGSNLPSVIPSSSPSNQPIETPPSTGSFDSSSPPSSHWPVDTPSSNAPSDSSFTPVSIGSLVPSKSGSERPIMMETGTPTTTLPATLSSIPTSSPAPSTAGIQSDTIAPSFNMTEVSGIQPISCPGFAEGGEGTIEETIDFSYRIQTNSSDTIALADLEKKLLLEVASRILSCNGEVSNRLLTEQNSTRIYQIGYPAIEPPSETMRCTPTEPTALSCFTIDSSFVLSTDNATAAKGKVLDTIGGIFDDGEAIKNSIPGAVSYHVNNQDLDQPPTSSPLPIASPLPSTSPVSSPMANPSGFPRQVTIFLSIVAAVWVLGCAYVLYRKRKKTLRQRKYAATQALLGKDYLENAEIYDENISPYGDNEDHQQRKNDEPETSSNTDHEDDHGPTDDELSSGTGKFTTYEADEAKKSSDDGCTNPDGGDTSERADSAVDMLLDEKLRISETGVVTGFIDAETAHSVASDLTDQQPYNGVDTRYESVVTMAQVFDDAEALAEAEATKKALSMMSDISDVIIVRSLLLLPIVPILFGNVEYLFALIRTAKEGVDPSRALVPYTGNCHGDQSVTRAGSDSNSLVPDQADDEQPDTGGVEYIVRSADEDDQPDQPDSCCSSTNLDAAGANAVTTRGRVDDYRDNDIDSRAEFSHSERNDDPLLVQDLLSQNESDNPLTRHDELDNSSVSDCGASMITDSNFVTGNGIANIQSDIRSDASYDESNSNDSMSYDSNRGASGGHDCQPSTSYERNADFERSSVDRDDSMNNNLGNPYGNDNDKDDLNNDEGDDFPDQYIHPNTDDPRIKHEHSDGGGEHLHKGSVHDESDNRSEVNGDDSYLNTYCHDNDEHSNAFRIGEDYIDEEIPTFPHGRGARSGELYYDQPSINSLDVSNRSGGNHNDRGDSDDGYSHDNDSSGHSKCSGKP